MHQGQPSLLEPEEQVLSTLNRDGSRRWLRPRLSPGRFLSARRWVGYLLIALFTALPYITINGRPAMLLDIARREFALFGYVFRPTDTILLALFMVSLIVTIFLLTALLGRVWCGWACPQTVYLELVYRPIERLFEGPPQRGGKPGKHAGGVRTLLKYAVYLLVSLFLAHTFLAYFVGVERLVQWVQLSPLHHPGPFLVMLLTTGLMMFDFCFFREQTCIVACPYGRFQSVMLDRESLIISYDPSRGEPRGKLRRTPKNQTALPVTTGDCVDCGLCVETCPTGIDIREGLQMECVGCAQCIDACDSVMARIGRPLGLIRYSSQSRIEREPRKRFRPRLFFYPAILTITISVLLIVFFNKPVMDVTILRNKGLPYALLPASGEISNSLRVKVVNRTDVSATLDVELIDCPQGRIDSNELPISLAPGADGSASMLVVLPPEAFPTGRQDVTLRITDHADISIEKTYRLLGPVFTPDGTANPHQETGNE